MARILIADDEPLYCRQLVYLFASDGHETRVVSTGQEAIDQGARWRADILLTDWMLRGQLHGLHLALALRTVYPALRVLLVTGFPSDDLRAAAKHSGVLDFIERPFTLERISAAVQAALDATAPKMTLPPVAILEVDDGGAVRYANAWARTLFAETDGGEAVAHLDDLLLDSGTRVLAAGVDQWVAVRPRALRPTFWHLRAQVEAVDGTRLVVLRRQDDPQHMTNSVIEILLGLREDGDDRWELPGRVLLLSDSALARRLGTSLLETAGAGCYAVATLEEALRLLQNDEGLAYAVLDLESPGEELPEMVQAMAAARPGLTLVGASSQDNHERFRAAGVARFLPKPWRRPSLMHALAG